MGLAAQKLMLGLTGSASTTFSDEAGLVRPRPCTELA